MEKDKINREKVCRAIDGMMLMHGFDVLKLKTFEGDGRRGVKGALALEIFFYNDADPRARTWCWQVVCLGTLDKPLICPQMISGDFAQHCAVINAVCAGVANMTMPTLNSKGGV